MTCQFMYRAGLTPRDNHVAPRRSSTSSAACPQAGCPDIGCKSAHPPENPDLRRPAISTQPRKPGQQAHRPAAHAQDRIIWTTCAHRQATINDPSRQAASMRFLHERWWCSNCRRIVIELAESWKIMHRCA